MIIYKNAWMIKLVVLNEVCSIDPALQSFPNSSSSFLSLSLSICPAIFPCFCSVSLQDRGTEITEKPFAREQRQYISVFIAGNAQCL